MKWIARLIVSSLALTIAAAPAALADDSDDELQLSQFGVMSDSDSEDDGMMALSDTDSDSDDMDSDSDGMDSDSDDSDDDLADTDSEDHAGGGT